MADAFDKWWAADSDGPAEWHMPCMLNSSTPHQWNPSCGPQPPSPTPQPPVPTESNCSFQNATTYEDDIYKTVNVPLNDYASCCELCHSDSNCAVAQMHHGPGTASYDWCQLMATADKPKANTVSPPSLELACIPNASPQPPVPTKSNCSFQNGTRYLDIVYKTAHVPLNDYASCCELCHNDPNCAVAQMIHGPKTATWDICELMMSAEQPSEKVVSPPALELACIPKRHFESANIELV